MEEKRRHKNYSRMALFQAGEFILERKCLGILALPLITLNGTTRSANSPLGNALEHFCGYNYQHDTLDKFLRELKYLGIADRLLRDQVSFWQGHWCNSKESPSGLPFLCYYVDGNTKPLWSEKRVKKNKVTMLGRVMGCLEQVFVHDGFGHPVYVETYAGKGAGWGIHSWACLRKIEDALEGPGAAVASDASDRDGCCQQRRGDVEGVCASRTGITTSRRWTTTSGTRGRSASRGGRSAIITGMPRCGIVCWNWRIPRRRGIWSWSAPYESIGTTAREPS